VLDVTDNLLKELGVDWTYKHIQNGTATTKSTNTNDLTDSELEDLGGSLAYAVGNEVFAGFTNAFNLEFINIFNSKEDLINATINMLHQTEDANVNAIPSIVTINGEPADFRVTEEVIVGTIEEEDDDGNSVKQPLFKEAGVIFKVTPTIRDGIDEPDSILLDIDTEVSNFKLTSGFDENEGAQIKNNIATKIRVNDGDSIFIGGLKKGTSSKVVSKIPILGDLPLIGWLFKDVSNTNNVREIYIQITAEIVTEENKNSDIPVQNFRANPIAMPGADIYKIGK
jgi:general secretion pathway protein D